MPSTNYSVTTFVLLGLTPIRILPAHLSARAFRPPPLAQAAGREARPAAGREPAGGPRKRRAEDQGPGAGHRRHHGAAQEHRLPDRRQAPHAAIKGLNRLARRHTVTLRQSYLRVAKQAAMMAGRYAHAKQFNRHHRQVRFLRTRLGRLIRDIRRKIAGHQPVEAAFESPLSRAPRSARNGSANAAGSSIPSTPRRSSASAKERPGRPTSSASRSRLSPPCLRSGRPVRAAQHPGAARQSLRRPHTLRDALEGAQRLTGCTIERAYVDKGYRGHDAPNPRRVFISGQKR